MDHTQIYLTFERSSHMEDTSFLLECSSCRLEGLFIAIPTTLPETGGERQLLCDDSVHSRARTFASIQANMFVGGSCGSESLGLLMPYWKETMP